MYTLRQGGLEGNDVFTYSQILVLFKFHTGRKIETLAVLLAIKLARNYP
jgi:hypothetical protein